MDVINGYKLTESFSTSNAGMCQWAFAEKDGIEYFVKQFLSPKYPSEDSGLSPSIVEIMRDKASSFFETRTKFYDALYECRSGNNAVAVEFFRDGSHYYAVSEKVSGSFLPLASIQYLPEDKKRVLLRSISYSVMRLHEKRLVHSDLKPDNLLFKETLSGHCTAKIIDFDSGYFTNDIPEEIVGDQVYFSPEVILHNCEWDVPVSEKADIFSLGLIFHQLWVGELPMFDHSECAYAGEALLEHLPLYISAEIPEDVRAIITRMLSKYQDDRPTALEVWTALGGKKAAVSNRPKVRINMPKASNANRFRAPSADDL